jgi:hypothetical protein
MMELNNKEENNGYVVFKYVKYPQIIWKKGPHASFSVEGCWIDT